MSLSTVRLHQLLVAAAFLVPCVVLVGAAWWNRAEVLREEDSAVVRTAAVMHEHASKVFDTAELAMDREAPGSSVTVTAGGTKAAAGGRSG